MSIYFILHCSIYAMFDFMDMQIAIYFLAYFIFGSHISVKRHDDATFYKIVYFSGNNLKQSIFHI